MIAIGYLCSLIGLYCIMNAMVKRSRFRDNQGKLAGFMALLMIIGILLILTSYNGLLRGPLQAVGFFSSKDLAKYRPIHGHGQQHPHDAEDSGEDNVFYGIMFDAGSTGSRVHVFKFQHTLPGQQYKFLGELFEIIKPGLSSYADEPQKGAESLRELMDKAKAFIPENKWKHTPIALKATAGLRLLPKKEQADNLLAEVLKLFQEYPFHVVKDSVQIMGGDDEGIFGWFTVNFLFGTMGDSKKMVGVLDLGGGSTQMTFVPHEHDTLSSVPKDYLEGIDILGTQYQLYTHSYLGLGLMSGRLQTLGGKESSKENPDTFTSVCFKSDYSGTWEHGSHTYNIKGSDVSGSRFDACYENAKKVLTNYQLVKPEEIKHRNFCLISYYYDRAVEADLIDEDKGGDIKVRDYSTAAKNVCDNLQSSKPFLCLDLCYISAVLSEGFALPQDKNLMLRKKINNTETSWALGAIFKVFQSEAAPAAR